MEINASAVGDECHGLPSPLPAGLAGVAMPWPDPYQHKEHSMNDVPRQRRNSFAAPEKNRTATVTVAQNSLKVPLSPTRTVTEQEVRGFTQADPSQHPTVYLRDAISGDPSGRITQEHNNPKNVGAHPQHGNEWYFQNVSRNIIAHAKAVSLSKSASEYLPDAASFAIRNPQLNTQPRQLVEVFTNDNLDVIATHKSRSEFQDLSGPGMQEARKKMVQSLKHGPTSVNSLAKMPKGSKDDWHVL
jgi:hypothetical protein